MNTIPTFVLSHDKRIEPNGITNIVVFDPSERTELLRLARDAQAIADSISSGVEGFFYLNDQFVPSTFLDRMAEAFNRCEVVYLHKRVFSASEDYLVKFRATLTEPERLVVPLCVAILIAQGRLEMCLPKDGTATAPATH
jgi:hypothetical protein